MLTIAQHRAVSGPGAMDSWGQCMGLDVTNTAALFVQYNDSTRYTLRASLSGIFLQTLPELVTPLTEGAPDSAGTGYTTD